MELKQLVRIACSGLLLCLVACRTPQQAESQPRTVIEPRVNADDVRVYQLKADKLWQLSIPGEARFDASGLLITGQEMYTVNDRGPELYRIILAEELAMAEPAGNFLEEQLRELPGLAGAERFDVEGIARDEEGTIYICEEASRSVFALRRGEQRVRQLKIDLTPVQHLFSTDLNASFEGIATGGGKLYLANERDKPTVIVVDLRSGQVLEHFYVQPWGFAFGGSHYSDLAWHEGRLFILDRNFRCILEVDTEEHRLVAQYSFAAMEQQQEVAYQTQYPTGTMEGLSVTKEFFYLITDNNGLPRKTARGDRRPTLFRVRR